MMAPSYAGSMAGIMTIAKRKLKKPPVMRRRIVYTTRERITRFLWWMLCASLVAVFFFMAWFMYNPRNRLAHNLKYGQRYLAAADYSKAVTEFRRVLAMDKRNADAYRGLMEVAIRSEDTDTAVSLYHRAGETLVSYKEPLERLLELRAVERVDEENFDGAFSVADTVQDVTGDDNEAALIRALVIDGMLSAAAKKAPEDAIALYRRLLEVEHMDAAAVYERMAHVYIDWGNDDEAILILDEGLAATGSEVLAELRSQYTQENAEVFLPDEFIRDLNQAMAEGDFVSAGQIVGHELFRYRIEEYAQPVNELGEQTFDFSAIQPADMNTSIYAEYSDAGGLLMLIVDWERTTEREAVFNELVYLPAGGQVYALSHKERVTEENTLTDEGYCYRLEGENLMEIPSDEYYDSLSAAYAEGAETGGESATEAAGEGLEGTDGAPDADFVDETGTESAGAEGIADSGAGRGQTEGVT